VLAEAVRDMKLAESPCTGIQLPGVVTAPTSYCRLRDGRPWPAPTIVSVWRECENYVAACAPAIREVAARPLASRTLTYAETAHIAAEALTGIRRPSMPDWFEDAQQLGRRLEIGPS
jgi:hypothetical protein